MTRLDSMSGKQRRRELWQIHDSEWRNPFEVISQWQNVKPADPNLLHFEATDDWWRILDETESTLLVTREYEHLIIAMTVVDDRPLISYLQLPHPSGIAVNAEKKVVYVASTRNPNLIFDFGPVAGNLYRRDVMMEAKEAESYIGMLLPQRIRFYPGCFYMHDLSIIKGRLYANSVGQNTIVRLDNDGGFKRVWWPRCIEKLGKPIFDRNYIQLNSIAAGSSISQSYFSASADKISVRRPGHRNFPVNRRGVIFSGQTREPIVSGLTRPHSARLYKGKIFVDDSGYGELVTVDDSKVLTVTRLPGWTRGLAFHKNIAFVGSSRVLPRFEQYAPGLDSNRTRCGLHAVDLKSGQIQASLYWSYGNQIFAIELIPRNLTIGFPIKIGNKPSSTRGKNIFYSFHFQRLKHG